MKAITVARISVSFALLLAVPLKAQTFFTDVTDRAHIPPYSIANVTVGDYDNDGWPDLFVAENWGRRIALFHSEDAGWFADRSDALQVDFPPVYKGRGASSETMTMMGTWISSSRWGTSPATSFARASSCETTEQRSET